MIQVGHLGPGGDAPKNWRAYRELSEATTTPIATGESLFGLEEGFKALIDNRAVDIVHPDPLTSGSIRETKRICDYAALNGVQTAIHFAGSPVGCMASVHMAATLKEMLAMENHAVDIPWWADLVTADRRQRFHRRARHAGSGHRAERGRHKGAHPQGRLFRADAAV
jgi:L-alanine-DL-glutamate epimerase-like enolase superfamily enzyme